MAVGILRTHSRRRGKRTDQVAQQWEARTVMGIMNNASIEWGHSRLDNRFRERSSTPLRSANDARDNVDI